MKEIWSAFQWAGNYRSSIFKIVCKAKCKSPCEYWVKNDLLTKSRNWAWILKYSQFKTSSNKCISYSDQERHGSLKNGKANRERFPWPWLNRFPNRSYARWILKTKRALRKRKTLKIKIWANLRRKDRSTRYWRSDVS